MEAKKSGKLKVFIIFFIIIAIASCVGLAYYSNINSKETIKNEFFSLLSNNDISFFTSDELYKNIKERTKKVNYKVSSDITLDTTMKSEMFPGLDLSKFSFNYNLSNDVENEKTYSRLISNYSGNTLLILDSIITDKRMAIKSDEIVNRYVGVKKKKAEEVYKKLFGEDNKGYANIEKLKNFVFDREKIDIDESLKDLKESSYAKIIVNNMPYKNFSKEQNVVIAAENEQIYTTQYTVSLNSSEANVLFTELAKNLKNDNSFVKNFVSEESESLVGSKSETSSQNSTKNGTVEIQGEENNYNSVALATAENVENRAENGNTSSIQNNTVSNSTGNTTNVTNTSTATNTLRNETQNETVLHQTTTQNNETETEQENASEQQQNNNSEQQNNNNPGTTERQASNTVIEEEENLRMKGYIAINDDETEEFDADETIVAGNYQETFENISKLIKNINWSTYLLTGSKVNCEEEELTEKFDEILSDLIKQNYSLNIKMYVDSNGKVIKLSFEIPENKETFDIQIISKDENEKTLSFTSLEGEGEEANGYTLNIYKKKTDTILNHKISINKIYQNKIIQKMNANIETKGTSNSKKYTNTAKFAYSNSEGELKISTDNKLSFDADVEIEDLNDDNCLFLNKLSDEELESVKSQIKDRISEVWNEKNRNLNIIDMNNANSVVQQGEEEEKNEDSEEKIRIKEILIQSISNKMADYENEGKEFKLKNLENLKIDGYEVDVTLSDNLAIITINGYKFKLDSDFNLSDS